MNRVAFLLIFLLSFNAASSVENTYVGNGGHVVVCFDQPAKNFKLKNGFLNTELLAHVTVLQTLDYYVAKRSLEIPTKEMDSTDIKDIAGLDFESLRQLIHKRFKVVGEPHYSQFKCLADRLGYIWEGQPIRGTPLNATKDARLPFQLPNSCIIVQAVVRQNADFYYHAGVINTLSFIRRNTNVDQLAILQLHEEFYALTAEVYGDTDARNARNLLSLLLRSQPRKEDILKQISFWGPALQDPCK